MGTESQPLWLAVSHQLWLSFISGLCWGFFSFETGMRRSWNRSWISTSPLPSESSHFVFLVSSQLSSIFSSRGNNKISPSNQHPLISPSLSHQHPSILRICCLFGRHLQRTSNQMAIPPPSPLFLLRSKLLCLSFLFFFSVFSPCSSHQTERQQGWVFFIFLSCFSSFIHSFFVSFPDFFICCLSSSSVFLFFTPCILGPNVFHFHFMSALLVHFLQPFLFLLRSQHFISFFSLHVLSFTCHSFFPFLYTPPLLLLTFHRLLSPPSSSTFSFFFILSPFFPFFSSSSSSCVLHAYFPPLFPLLLRQTSCVFEAWGLF